ncbi:MFS transporter [Chloroflexota bacterium]
MPDNYQSVIGEKKPPGKWLVMAAIMLGVFMIPLDTSIVNTVLPTITTYFHTDISIVQWVPTVYLLAISCLIMLYGRLGDIIGHKKIFLYGLAGFIVSSMLCGLSQNIWLLIVFRVLQGLVAGMPIAVGFALAVAAFPAEERGKALGFYATSIAVAMALGPTLGGAIAEHLSWRYIFFLNVPIGVVSLIFCSRIIPPSSIRPGQRLDIPGALTFFIFLPVLLLYFNRSEEWGWVSPVSLTLLAIAVVLGGLFFWIERTSKQPMVNLKIFTERVFSLATISYFLYFISFSTVLFLTPFYLKFVLEYSIFEVGLIMASSPVVFMFTAPLSGMASDRFGTRIFAISGMCIAALGLLLLSTLNESDNAFDVVWRLALTAFGGAIFGTPNNSTIMGSVPPQHLGIASGLLAAMRYSGMVFGIAITGAILYGLAPVTASADPSSFTSENMGDFMNGLQWAYIAGAFAAVASALTSTLAIKRRP